MWFRRRDSNSNINEAIKQTQRSFFHDWINKLFPEEDNVPTTLFDARKVAGSATYKQSKTVWHFHSVYLFCHKNKKFANFVCLAIKETVKDIFSLLIKVSSPKLHSAPFFKKKKKKKKKRKEEEACQDKLKEQQLSIEGSMLTSYPKAPCYQFYHQQCSELPVQTANCTAKCAN